MNYKNLIIWINKYKPEYIEMFRQALLEWLIDYNLEWFENMSEEAKKEIIRTGQHSGQLFPINLNSLTTSQLLRLEDTKALDDTFLDYIPENPIQLTKLMHEFHNEKKN